MSVRGVGRSLKRRGLLAGAAALTAAVVARAMEVKTALAAPIGGTSDTSAAAVTAVSTYVPMGQRGVAMSALVTATSGVAFQATIGQPIHPAFGEGAAILAVSNSQVVGVYATSQGSYGVHGITSAPTLAGVYGVSGISPTSVGVRGQSSDGTGVYGTSNKGAGVYGSSQINAGVFGTSPFIGVAGLAATNAGVQGTSNSGAGVAGQSTSNAAVYGTSPYAGVYGTSGNIGVWGVSSGSGTAVFGQATGPDGFAGQFAGRVFVNGSFTVVGGAKSAAVKRKDGSHARVYCQESPEPWFEDFGTAQLKGGVALVALSADFDEVVKGDDYRVFLTPIGVECSLYVTRKEPHRFEVRSVGAPAKDGTFDYRIVARRADPVGGRLERIAMPGAPQARQAPVLLDLTAIPQPAPAEQPKATGGQR